MQNLTTETFKQFISSDEKVLVEFHASWCMPCKAMEPMLDQAHSEAPNRIAKLNIDDMPDIADQMGIKSIPTMLIFKNSMMIDKKVGSMKNSKEIVNLLN